MSIDIEKHRNEIARHLRNGKSEMTDGGLLIKGGMNALCNGVFGSKLYRGGEVVDPALDPNRVVGEALAYIINAAFNGVSQNTQFYIGLFSGNVTPADDWTGANVVAKSTEFTDYNEATRVEWVSSMATAATKSSGNTGNEAMFSIAGTGRTVRGAFLATASDKGGTTGILVAATRFAADRANLASPDRIGIEYSIRAQDAGA